MLSLQEKQTIIVEVSKIAKNALSVVIADFRGMTVDKMTELRKASREAGVYLRIIRNTLMRRIVKGTDYECLKEVFVGPTLIAFSREHPGSAARLFKEFAKTNSAFKIKAAVFNGEYISADCIDRLACIPTYKEAIIHLMLIMKEAAAGKLVRIMAALCNQKKLI